MATMNAAEPHAPQTPAQWAVRWFAVVAVGALLAAAPVAHVVWHGVFGEAVPMLPTRTQVPAPALTLDGALAGSWMAQKEKQLQEDSPVTWRLRSAWNELRYRAGVPRSKDVFVGDDEWLFFQHCMRPDVAAFARHAPQRRAFLAEVRDEVKAAGAELVIALVPDKERVHPEKWAPGGAMPPEKAGAYAAALADFAALGIPAVDLAAAMTQARAADPATALYYRGDTHWRKEGAIVAGAATAAFLEARYGDALGPRVPMALSGATTARLVSDLTANLGLAVIEMVEPGLPKEPRTLPMSLLSHQLAEVHEYYGIEVVTPEGRVGMFGDDEAATVWMIGTSFARVNGANAVALSLGRPIRTALRVGASGLAALRAARPQIRPGMRAKVVLWEIVERGYYEPDWREPKR
jgi:hypothetical protein